MPYYTRNTGKPWKAQDVSQLKQLIRQNAPTRVAGFKLGRTENAVRDEASKIGLSLKPTNQSPYTHRKP
ncbi:MAG TPA: hypothetical protein VI953_03780 [Candidatus Paceibacterota bacterium]